eukprot:s467_g29.t1
MEVAKPVGAHDTLLAILLCFDRLHLWPQDLESSAIWRWKATVAHLEETALEELKLRFACEPSAAIRDEKSLTKCQGQVLHGLMRYACGFFSGKFLHQVCAEVMSLSGSSMRKSPEDVVSFCDYAIQMLQAARLRRISVGFEKRPLLIEGNFAGIGAVIVDVATGARCVCCGETPKELLEKWRVLVGDHLICQIELYVMVLIRWQFKHVLHNGRSLWWVDNDAARFCAIKGLSPSASMRALVREFYSIDAEYPTYSWVERVPSASNVSDGPSRGSCAEALALLKLEKTTDFVHPKDLIANLLKLS